MKKIIQIVRIEHYNDGLGFWRTEACNVGKHSQYSAICKKHWNKEKYPTFSEDTSLVFQTNKENINPDDYLFAFKTMTQLKRAFTPTQIKECIDKFGFRILLLSVNDYFQSPFQVIFRNPISTEDISDLFL